MTMANIWNPYQAERNFQFSRNISYYATGTFGALVSGTAQDVLAMIPSIRSAPRKAGSACWGGSNMLTGTRTITFSLSRDSEPVARIHSDNHLWAV